MSACVVDEQSCWDADLPGRAIHSLQRHSGTLPQKTHPCNQHVSHIQKYMFTTDTTQDRHEAATRSAQHHSGYNVWGTTADAHLNARAARVV